LAKIYKTADIAVSATCGGVLDRIRASVQTKRAAELQIEPNTTNKTKKKRNIFF
jgi:hypothetical protein